MGLPKVKTSSEFRENLAETMNDVNNGVEHIISHKTGNIVLISESNFSNLLKQLEDLKQIALGISEIDSDMGISHTKAKAKLNSLKKKWS
jgi:PHD/YefM family antitoxin component YafN of YafNO toxin-antitoxin module